MELIKKHLNKFNTILIAANAAVLVIFTCLLAITTKQDHYYPVNDDEHVYINSARMFSENTCVLAPTSIEGKRSSIGKTHWYGPVFHVVYGSIFKIFGSGKFVFLWSNYIFLMLAIVVIYFFQTTLTKKLLFGFLILSSYAAFPFVLTFFPEPFIIFITICAIWCYSRVKGRNSLLLFIAVIMLATLVRVTFSFFFVLVFFLRSDMVSLKLWQKILFAFVTFLWGVVVFKFFCAPAQVQVLKSAMNFDSRFVQTLIGNLTLNIQTLYKYLFFSPFGLVPLLTFPICYILIFTSRPNSSDQRVIKYGALCLTTLSVIIFLSFYTVDIFFFEKQLIIFYIFLIYSLIQLSETPKFLFLINFIVFLPFSYAKVREHIKDRIENAIVMKKDYPKLAAFDSCVSYLKFSKKYNNLVLLDLNNGCYPRNSLLGNLTFKVQNTCVSYMTSLSSINDKSLVDLLNNNKVKPDYVITTDLLKGDDHFWTLRKTSNCFNLYEVR
jgi:hypothetical protein